MFKVGDEVLVKGSIVEIENDEYDACPVAVGFDKGRSEWFAEEELIPADKTYTQGLADAWELVRKLGEIEQDEREKMFSYRSVKAIIEDCTIEEVMDRIKAYEKEKEIEVGDVVEGEEGTKALVIDEATENTCFIFTENGCVEEWYKKHLKKTGKKISIGDLLRQIGE
jgi:hypothetical protein